ncbi:hypothetical protein DVB88_01030 [Tsukamurella pulmonis]|nr:hypothetical protein DVB88_01030 [Tsukamurella pulmonis]
MDGEDDLQMPSRRTVVVPSGWDRASVCAYAEHVIARDTGLSSHLWVRVKLLEEQQLEDLTSRWSVSYVVHRHRKALSIVTDPTQSGPRAP